MAESEEELKSLLMKGKEESEKVGLKLNIHKTKIMASGPFTSWEIDGETVETVTDYFGGGSKITADGDCNHEIKRCLLLGRKVMTNLDSILKSKDSSGESGHPCLVPDFRGNAFNFSPLRIMFAVGLSYIAFNMLRCVPSIPAFWRVSLINGC